MSNLKKILALVLALVMTMSVMSFASAATAGTTFTDDASITNYDESVQVLQQLGVLKGDDNDNFNPTALITRAEAAAIIYRVVSTDVSDKNIGLYASYATKFSDVSASHWAAGYIGFCANGQYIQGYENDVFGLNDYVTGYQILAIMMRAMGYDQNGEFTGTGWEIRTATQARKLGITDTVTGISLGDPIDRATVAELVFRAMTCASTVSYTQLMGYQPTYLTLGYTQFGLVGGVHDDDSDPDTADAYDSGYTVSVSTANAATLLTASDATIDAAKDQLKGMTTRGAAVADADTTTYSFGDTVDGTEYGEPVAYWFKNNDAAGTVDSNVIVVRFNPVASYTTGVTTTTLYADAKAAGAKLTASTYASSNYDNIVIAHEDGTVDKVIPDRATTGAVLGDQTAAAVTLTKTKADGQTTIGGKGTETDLYVVEGIVYVVVKNAYTDTLDAVYGTSQTKGAITTKEAFTLTNGFEDGNSDNVFLDPTGISKDWTVTTYNNGAITSLGTVLVYHMYGGDGDDITDKKVDVNSIYVASSANATVTRTYMKANAAGSAYIPESSYFVAGKTYNYNCNSCAGLNLDDYILDRDDSNNQADEFNKNQIVFTDKYGYVVYTQDQAAAVAETGYLLVRSGTYGGSIGDNRWYANFSVILNGKQTTIKGAVAADSDNDGTYDTNLNGYYLDQKLASDAYGAELGLYAYQLIDGYYALYRVEANGDTGSDASELAAKGAGTTTWTDTVLVMDGSNTNNVARILAGEADAINNDANVSVNGLLNDDTLFIVANYNDSGVITGYTVTTGFTKIKDLFGTDKDLTVTMMAGEQTTVANRLYVEYAVNDDDEITIIFVRNAAQESDKANESTADKVFFLMDETPLDTVKTYDTHTVVRNGKVTTMDFEMNYVAGAPMSGTLGFYILPQAKVTGYVDNVTAAGDDDRYGTITYEAPGVLAVTDSQGATEYIAMASNCVVYGIDANAQTCEAIAKADLSTTIGTGTTYNGIVAATDAYGFATLVYVDIT
jgi:hypothetical protein